MLASGGEAARKGWCLYKVGCKGPQTYNNCATVEFNDGTSWPVKAGHGCAGCSEPNFWDAGSFYTPLSAPTADITTVAKIAAVAGVGAAVALGALDRAKKRQAQQAHEKLTVKDL